MAHRGAGDEVEQVLGIPGGDYIPIPHVGCRRHHQILNLLSGARQSAYELRHDDDGEELVCITSHTTPMPPDS